MKSYVCFGLLASLLSVFGEMRLGEPITNAHAHNDYEHRQPLWDALAQGFCSVEADIYLVDGALLVAHNREDVKPEKTLEKLYLDPLSALARKNGGRIYPHGPTVILLIDIKTEAETTYAVLKPALLRYASMLTHFAGDKVETNAVTVILTGNRPYAALRAERDRLAAYDGRLDDLGKGLPVSFMPLVSDSYAARFPSAKQGALDSDDQAAFLKAIRQAHAEGRFIRFWATKDDRVTWEMLRKAGVDLINTDDLAGLAAYLTQTQK